MSYYVCALPNKKGTASPQEFVSDDLAKIEEWARRHDREGWGVYDCHNPLKAGATRRCKETIAMITNIYVDIDPKDVVESPDEVDARLHDLLLTPSEVRTSGRGRHVVFYLKEPIDADDTEMIARVDAVRDRLTEILCGDRQVLHQAALRRRLGTHNTKEGARLECKVLTNGGAVPDLTELEEMCALYDRALLTRRPAAEKEGGENVTYIDFGDGGIKAPIDVEGRLAVMRYQGPGDSGINATWWTCMGSLLRQGKKVAEAMDVLHAAAQANCQDDPNKVNWYKTLAGMAERWLNHEPEFTHGLESRLYAAWHRARLEHKRPRLVWRSDLGLQVRGFSQAAAQPLGAAAADGGVTVTALPPSAPKGEPQAGKAPTARRALVLRPFEPFDPATLPARAWLYAKHYQRRTVSLTAGPGGMGKSSLVLVECIAMATGRNLLGEQPTERLRIWLHNGEDPLEEILRRVGAICLHYKIPQEELRGQLWTTSGNEFPLRVAKGYSNLEIDEALVRQISGAIGDNHIDVAAFDPLVTLHSVSEGDPGKMDAVVRLFAGIADEHDTSIELNHHVRKPLAGSDADHDVHDIRGVMAITDAVRAARVLNRMNKADAESAGIDEVTRQSHFRVDKAKGNYSPAQVATWRRFVSVELPNTDNVGVVEPWDFPGQGTATPEKAAADQRADQVFLTLLDKFLARNVNVSASNGPNYAPAKFAGEREATAAKVPKAALKAAMTRLLDAGRIRSEPIGRADRSSHRLVPWQGRPE